MFHIIYRYTTIPDDGSALSAYTGKAAGAAGDGQDGGGRMVISRPIE